MEKYFEQVETNEHVWRSTAFRFACNIMQMWVDAVSRIRKFTDQQWILLDVCNARKKELCQKIWWYFWVPAYYELLKLNNFSVLFFSFVATTQEFSMQAHVCFLRFWWLFRFVWFTHNSNFQPRYTWYINSLNKANIANKK